VQTTIKGVCATVRGRVAQIHKASADAGCLEASVSHSLGKAEIACLGLHAFIAVFTRRSTWYSAVIPALNRQLRQHDVSATQCESV
jgi:hypothetical protein